VPADRAARAAQPRPEGRTGLRVRYSETDRMGVVYHAHYLVWFELGRTELMRQLGCDYRALEERRGIYFPVREAGARYLSPARYDDVLEVRTRLDEVGGARVRFDYELIRGDDGKLLARGFSEHAAVDGSGKPQRLPADLAARLRGEEP